MNCIRCGREKDYIGCNYNITEAKYICPKCGLVQNWTGTGVN